MFIYSITNAMKSKRDGILRNINNNKVAIRIRVTSFTKTAKHYIQQVRGNNTKLSRLESHLRNTNYGS
jgi:hypothetical protein